MLQQFNTCGWNPNPEDSSSDAGTGGTGGTGGTMGTGGTLMRNETIPADPSVLPPTTLHADPTPPTPALVSTEYVDANITAPPESDGMMCATWAGMTGVPFGSDIAASYDYNVRFSCEITARNKNKCTARCLNGGKIIGKNKFVMTCKCPRYVSLLPFCHFVLCNV